MTDYRQDYHGQIGQQWNVNHLTLADDLGLRSAAATHLPPEVTVVATLINRDPQYEALMDFLEERLASSQCHRPALVILHGCDAELHRAFVLRCEQLDLPEMLGETELCIPFGRIKWPEKVSRIEKVLQHFSACFNLPRRPEQTAIEAKLHELAHSACFSHHVDARAWEPMTAELIDRWITYIRQDWPELPSGRLVVGFLCIEHPPQKTERSEAARSYVEALHHRYQSDPCLLITDELQSIRKIHVSDWIAEARRFLGDRCDEAAILDAPEYLFRKGQESRPLAELFHELLGLLQAAYRPPGVIFQD